MNSDRFDSIARRFAGRKLSRRALELAGHQLSLSLTSLPGIPQIES